MSDRPGDAHPVRVSCVVVDDNAAMLGATSDLLASADMDVIAAEQTGLGALAALDALPTTVVVLDLRLPDMSGLEVARRVTEIARRKTAIVLHTSYDGTDIVPSALDAGISGVVVKSGSPAALLEAIKRVAAGGVYVDPALRGAQRGDE
jgi:DNA-binding NarL/FixJ family response regulator